MQDFSDDDNEGLADRPDDSLLLRYVAGRVNNDERAAIDAWIATAEDNADEVDVLRTVWDASAGAMPEGDATRFVEALRQRLQSIEGERHGATEPSDTAQRGQAFHGTTRSGLFSRIVPQRTSRRIAALLAVLLAVVGGARFRTSSSIGRHLQVKVRVVVAVLDLGPTPFRSQPFRYSIYGPFDVTNLDTGTITYPWASFSTTDSRRLDTATATFESFVLFRRMLTFPDFFKPNRSSDKSPTRSAGPQHVPTNNLP